MEVEKTPGCADSTERISRHNFLSVYCVAYVYSCWKLLCVQSCCMQVAFGICVLMNSILSGGNAVF